MKIISANFSDLLEPNVEIKNFPDGDSYVRILDKIEGKKVTLFHRLYPEQDKSLMQALLVLKMLEEKGHYVTMVTPYLPYSRQDKIWKEGEALSSKYICEMLSWAGAKEMITFDCHFLKKEGEFNYGNLKIKNISLNKKLTEYAEKLFGKEKFEIVSPDMGSNYMVGTKGKSMKKERGEYVEGTETFREIKEVKMDFEVQGKNVLIIDDMIAGGGTMIKAVENLKKHKAKKIIACAAHGFFLKDSLNKLQSMCNDVFVSNTIPSKVSKVNFMDLLGEEL